VKDKRCEVKSPEGVGCGLGAGHLGMHHLQAAPEARCVLCGHALHCKTTCLDTEHVDTPRQKICLCEGQCDPLDPEHILTACSLAPVPAPEPSGRSCRHEGRIGDCFYFCDLDKGHTGDHGQPGTGKSWPDSKLTTEEELRRDHPEMMKMAEEHLAESIEAQRLHDTEIAALRAEVVQVETERTVMQTRAVLAERALAAKTEECEEVRLALTDTVSKLDDFQNRLLAMTTTKTHQDLILWNYLRRKLARLRDNNRTARQIFDRVRVKR
jgi:hypothetical protein